jgi:DNA primase
MTLMLSREAKDYIEKRGWVKGDYSQIGVFSEGESVYFPISDYSDNVVGAIGRSIKSHQYFLRLTSPTCGYFLWHGVESDRTLFLVEGVFDLGWLLQNGLHAAAYLNNSLTGAQLRIIQRFYKRVVIIPDSDDEGKRGGARTVRSLRAAGVPSVREFSLTVFKDVGACFERGGKSSEYLIQSLRRLEVPEEKPADISGLDGEAD